MKHCLVGRFNSRSRLWTVHKQSFKNLSIILSINVILGNFTFSCVSRFEEVEQRLNGCHNVILNNDCSFKNWPT